MLRCSTDQQTETSIPAQRELLADFARTHGMSIVGEINLEGVSGSKPGNRPDLQELTNRKEIANDFEVLLVQTEDRLTRSGSGHTIWIQEELRRRGIQIVYASSDTP